MNSLSGLADDHKLQVLKQVPEFEGLDEAVLVALGRIMDLRMYPRPATGWGIGKVRKSIARRLGVLSGPAPSASSVFHEDPNIIHAAEQAPETISLAIVADGRVRLTQGGARRMTERSLGPGTLFGEQGVCARAGGGLMPIGAQAVGRAWVMEAQPRDLDPLFKAHPALKERILRGFEAAKVAPEAVDALKQAPELRTARLDHLFALAEGAEIRTATQGETLAVLKHGAPPSALCLPLDGHVAYRPSTETGAHRRLGGVPVLGLSELVRGDLVDGTYEAQEQLRYMVIPAQRFEDLLVRVPEFLRAVRDAARVDPLKRRALHGQRAGAEVLLLLSQPGLDLPMAALSDLVGEAIATHLYDRVCVLHLTKEGAELPAARTVRAPLQDERYRDSRSPASILHSWLTLPADEASALQYLDAHLKQTLSERTLGEWSYDVVVIDPSGLSDSSDDPEVEDPALRLAGVLSITRAAYLHRNPERRLPMSLLGGRIEVVPVGVLGSKRDLYPFGEIMLDMDQREDGAVGRVGRLVASAGHYSRTRTQRLSERMEGLGASLRNRRGPFDIADETVGSMQAWSPRTVRLRLEEHTITDLREAKMPEDHRLPKYDDAFVGSVNRLARALTGRRVGLALGGGGAFGYVHAALIQKLKERDYQIPIDLLSGSSFGTVVGTYYAAGDDDFARLKAHHYYMTAAVSVGLLTTSAMTTAIDLDLGTYDLNELDISLFPVVTNADTGQEGAIRRGTIGYGVRASGSLPPFAPTIEGHQRFLDGGLAANVPVQILADEGAGLVISSNPIPDPEPRRPKDPLPIPKLGAFLRMSNPRDRLMDGIRSTLILMRAASSSQERFADVRYMATTQGTTMFEFGNVDDIIDAANNDPEQRLLQAAEEAVEAWRARLNHPPARIRANPDHYLDMPPGVRFEEVGGRVVRTRIADTLLEELSRFLVQRTDLKTIEIQVSLEAVSLETAGTEARAEQAAALVVEALVKGQVSEARLRTRVLDTSERGGRGVNFRVLAHRESGQADAQLEIRRARLVAGARQALADDQPRLARLLSLEAARPELQPDRGLAPDSEAVLRDVLDVPVRRLYQLDGGEQKLLGAVFSPDGRWLAVVGGGGPTLARIHDAEDPRRYVTLETPSDGPILTATWSPDGQRLAVTGHMTPRQIWVWDTSELQDELHVRALGQLPTQSWDVWGVEFSPDSGSIIGTDLSAGQAPAVALWTTVDARAIRLGHTGGRINMAGFSADGRWIASGCEDGKVGLWHADSGEHIAWLADGETPVRAIAWSQEGTKLAAAIGREVWVWADPSVDAAPQRLPGHLRSVTCLAWSVDGAMLASGSRDRAVRLWHAEQGILHTVLGGHNGPLSRVSFHPELDAVASCANDRVYVWSTITGDLQATIADNGGQVTALDWRPDGSELVSAAQGKVFVHDPYARGTVRFEVPSDGIRDVHWHPSDPSRAIYSTVEGVVEQWSPEDGAHLNRLVPVTGRPSPTAWHPQGAVFAVSIDQPNATPKLRIMNADQAAQAEVELPDARVRRLHWSPDGTYLLVIQARQILLFSYDGAALKLAHPAIDVGLTTYAWAPDSTRLAITRWVAGSSVDVWDVRTPWQARSPRDSSGDAAWTVAWSDDSKYLVSGHNDGAVLCFDESPQAARDGRPAAILTQRGGPAALAAAFQPGTHYLAASVGRDIVCYDLDRAFEPVGPKLVAHTGACRRLAWSADGERLASGGDDGRVLLWDPLGGRPMIALQGYRDGVEGLEWRPDGRRLISWAADATARVHLAHPEDVVQAAGNAAGSNELTLEEWERWLVGAGPRRATWPFDASRLQVGDCD